MPVPVWVLAVAVGEVEGAAIAVVGIVESVVAAAEEAGSIGGLAGMEIAVEWYMEGIGMMEVVAVPVDDVDRSSAWLVDAGVVELLEVTWTSEDLCSGLADIAHLLSSLASADETLTVLSYYFGEACSGNLQLAFLACL